MLVVDDDARVCRAVQELINLTNGMAFAACARNLSQALDADLRVCPSVALVDVQLPERAQGLAVIETLTNRGRPVVAMSISTAVRAAALAAGAVRFIDKGADAQQLLAALHQSRGSL